MNQARLGVAVLRATKHYANNLLNFFGIEVAAAGAAAMKHAKIFDATREAVNIYRETTVTNLPPLNDKQVDLLVERCGTTIGEALYLLEAIQKTKHLPGDVCEFGIAQGATSVQIAYMIQDTEKHLYLLDSFEGLSHPHEKDELIDDIFKLGSIEAYAGKMATPMAVPVAKLKSINFPEARTHIVKQMIEGQLKDLDKLPKRVAFAYFDMDLYEPTLLSLLWFDTVADRGSIVAVDDYGFLSSGVEKAVTEFLEGRDYCLTIPVKSAGHFCLLEKL